MTAEGPAAALYWRVERARARKGWSAIDLARRSGVDRSTVRRMRTSRRAPLPATVVALAEALAIDVDEALHLAGIIGLPQQAAQPDVLKPRAGEWTYDREAHALYVRLVPDAEGRVASTAEMRAIVQVDLDEHGRVLGIEVINPWPEASAAPEETT